MANAWWEFIAFGQNWCVNPENIKAMDSIYKIKMQLNCCNRDRDTGLQPIFLKINLEAGNICA